MLLLLSVQLVSEKPNNDEEARITNISCVNDDICPLNAKCRDNKCYCDSGHGTLDDSKVCQYELKSQEAAVLLNSWPTGWIDSAGWYLENYIEAGVVGLGLPIGIGFLVALFSSCLCDERSLSAKFGLFVLASFLMAFLVSEVRLPVYYGRYGEVTDGNGMPLQKM